MARIRTIKPEFPHSQSMGRVSRDARLLFVLMWTIADDSGRLRGNSRMLASLLFPYDDDARIKIGEWIEELERERCVVRYEVGSSEYMTICNWRSHQKIDKPSASKLPDIREASRILSKPRECSSEDLDLDLDLDQGKDQDQDQDRREVSSRIERSRTPIERSNPELAAAIDRWQDYWRGSHGDGRPCPDVRIDQLLRNALGAGWDVPKTIRAIDSAIVGNWKQWYDPDDKPRRGGAGVVAFTLEDGM